MKDSVWNAFVLLMKSVHAEYMLRNYNLAYYYAVESKEMSARLMKK